MRHKEFVDLLFNKKVIRHNMKRIQSRLHERLRLYELILVFLHLKAQNYFGMTTVDFKRQFLFEWQTL